MPVTRPRLRFTSLSRKASHCPVRAGTAAAPACVAKAIALSQAPTIGELAGKIGVPVGALSASVAKINLNAAAGKDTRFGRGDSAYDRFFGDQSVRPNPSMGPVETAPFYAIRIELGDLGTKGGLKVDAHARVIDTAGSPINGLYAVGNCAASPFANCYPGSGGTIGPAMAFALIAADHLAASA